MGNPIGLPLPAAPQEDETILDVIRNRTQHFIGDIGRCVRCMRQALMAAVVFALLYGLAWALALTPMLLDAIALATVCAWLLWISHILIYTARQFARKKSVTAPLAFHSALTAVRASLGGHLPDLDEAELNAILQKALRKLEQEKHG